MIEKQEALSEIVTLQSMRKCILKINRSTKRNANTTSRNVFSSDIVVSIEIFFLKCNHHSNRSMVISNNAIAKINSKKYQEHYILYENASYIRGNFSIDLNENIKKRDFQLRFR